MEDRGLGSGERKEGGRETRVRHTASWRIVGLRTHSDEVRSQLYAKSPRRFPGHRRIAQTLTFQVCQWRYLGIVLFIFGRT